MDIDSSKSKLAVGGQREMQTKRQRFIGYMIMRVLDPYLEGKVPLPPADVISARLA